MSAHSATPASTPSLVNRHLASLLVVLKAPPTADATLDVVEEWAQDLSPLVLSYRKALGAIRDEETELRVAAAVKQLAKRASESWRGSRPPKDSFPTKGKGRARVDDEVTELSDDPSVKTPRTVERPLAMTEVDMAAAAIEKCQAGQKCDRCAGYRSAPVDCVWAENATTCERCAQFQQGCYFDKVSVLGKTKKTRGGGSTTKKRIRPASPGPSVADASGSKKRRVDEPPRPLLRRPLDGASCLGLEQDDLDALDLDDESRGSFASSARSALTSRAVERSYTTWTSTSRRWRRPRLRREGSVSCAGL
ncbi:predicted protein [Postia placenta Mad-698-R]|nr:predicted protein [Postia placenta Mad-698-R]